MYRFVKFEFSLSSYNFCPLSSFLKFRSEKSLISNTEFSNLETIFLETSFSIRHFNLKHDNLEFNLENKNEDFMEFD